MSDVFSRNALEKGAIYITLHHYAMSLNCYH